MPPGQNKPIIGISSCLLGEPVRYDGNHKHAPPIIEHLTHHFSFHSFCPEVAIGLGVPRPPIHLILKQQQIYCVDVSDPSIDVTEQLIQCSQQQDWQQTLCGYIVKARSPSCGWKSTPVTQTKETTPSLFDSGVYTAQLIKRFPDLPIIEEEQLIDVNCREVFIRRVLSYERKKRNAG
ncbi:hypothetical protein A9Q81_10125 [Gammaproteobacteria bacterium 42_54_T18]|nr:hypothetical protein A9Q81_10125 [Gammaproteobacteria bacterium 42_54_T18]